VITFEAFIRAEAGIVWASFTVVDTSVSIATCRQLLHTTQLAAGACPGDGGAHSVAQDLYPDVTSLGTANSWTWGGREISGGKSFNNGTSVSDVRYLILLHLSVHCIAVCNTKVYQPKENLTPPFDGFSGEGVGGCVLVRDVHTIHILIVRVYCNRFLLCGCSTMPRWHCDHLCRTLSAKHHNWGLFLLGSPRESHQVSIVRPWNVQYWYY